MGTIITGAAGFIGKQATLAALSAGEKVICIDLPGADRTWFDAIASGIDDIHWVESDLSDITVSDWNTYMNLFTTTTVDSIMHLASIVGVQTVIENPETMIQDLMINTTLASFLRTWTDPLALFFSSSSEIYGEQDELVEEGDLHIKNPDGYPRGIYASQKLAAEHLFLNWLLVSLQR